MQWRSYMYMEANEAVALVEIWLWCYSSFEDMENDFIL